MFQSYVCCCRLLFTWQKSLVGAGCWLVDEMRSRWCRCPTLLFLSCFLVLLISLHVFNPLIRRDFKHRWIFPRHGNGNSPTAIGFNPWNKCNLFYRDDANWIYEALPSQIPVCSWERLSHSVCSHRSFGFSHWTKSALKKIINGG